MATHKFHVRTQNDTKTLRSFHNALVALTMSCAQAPKPADNHDADVQAIKDIEAQWNKDYEAKDADKSSRITPMTPC